MTILLIINIYILLEILCIPRSTQTLIAIDTTNENMMSYNTNTTTNKIDRYHDLLVNLTN